VLAGVHPHGPVAFRSQPKARHHHHHHHNDDGDDTKPPPIAGDSSVDVTDAGACVQLNYIPIPLSYMF
jgi:hypothetical protein